MYVRVLVHVSSCFISLARVYTRSPTLKGHVHSFSLISTEVSLGFLVFWKHLEVLISEH